MKPSLGWVSVSRQALAHASRLLESKGDGTVDEIGVLALHRAYADHFFPGTSVLHTRLRYALFIPWLYRALEAALDAKSTSPYETLQRLEFRLAESLKVGTGSTADIIGGTLVEKGRNAVQLAGASYWSALSAWGVVLPDASGKPYRRTTLLRRFARQTRSQDRDADGHLVLGESDVFVQLPPAPEDFLAGPLTFKLSEVEREFLRERLMSVRVGHPGQTTLLGYLAQDPAGKGVSPGAALSQIDAGPDQAMLDSALKVAKLAGVARAVFAALVEQSQESDGLSVEGEHRQHAERVRAEWGKEGLEVDVTTLPVRDGALTQLLDDTQGFIRGERVLSSLRPIYQAREHDKKGPKRVLLGDTLAAKERRKDWTSAHAEPLHYRWPWVRALLLELRTLGADQ